MLFNYNQFKKKKFVKTSFKNVFENLCSYEVTSNILHITQSLKKKKKLNNSDQDLQKFHNLIF